VLVELEALRQPIKEVVVLILYSALLHLLAVAGAALVQTQLVQMAVLAVALEIMLLRQVATEILHQHLHLKVITVEALVVALALLELAVAVAVHQRLVAQEKQLAQA
jgi:hypothetical protein